MANKRNYTYIELWKRKAIIECFLNKNESVKKCAQRLGVKYITAKHIVKVYKRTGNIETKLMKKSSNKVFENEMSNEQAFIPVYDLSQYCIDLSHYGAMGSNVDNSFNIWSPHSYDPNNTYPGRGFINNYEDGVNVQHCFSSYYDVDNQASNWTMSLLSNSNINAESISPIEMLNRNLANLQDSDSQMAANYNPEHGLCNFLGELVFQQHNSI